MKYADFRLIFAKYPVFRSNLIAHFTDKPAILRRQISEWINKGYIIQLKRGVYTLRDSDRETKLSPYFLANQLYTPSYISLETALSYYGLIPERVSVVTSVATQKTQVFINALGKFTYRQIKTAWFHGFVTAKDSAGQSFYIATAERALIDFLYFKSRELRNVDSSIFEESFRFQNLASLNKQKLRKIAMDLGYEKLCEFTELLIRTMR